MTEAEWFACSHSGEMFEVLRGKRFDPRLRRFAVECCRRIRHLITEEVFLQAVEAGEAFADDPQNNKSTIKAMAEASRQAVRYHRQYAAMADRHQLHAANAAIGACASYGLLAAFIAMREAAKAANRIDPESRDPVELRHQADLLRCIFGYSLFRPITDDHKYNNLTVKNLATNIYDDCRFQDLPILADALEEAGCTSADILSHLRGPGPHVRGCWALDLVLGKS